MCECPARSHHRSVRLRDCSAIVRSGSVVAREGNQHGCKLETLADRVGESVTERIIISYNAYPWGLGMSRGDGGCYGHVYIEGELRYFISGEFET